MTIPARRQWGGGKKLADGLFAVLWCLKGDLDYFARSLHLRHYNANDMCDLCPATRRLDERSLLYNNFGRDATWKSLCFTAAQWRGLYEGFAFPDCELSPT